VSRLRGAVGPWLPGGGRQSKGVDNPRRGGLTPLAVSLTLYGGGLTPYQFVQPSSGGASVTP
jgi:hypothetical protein